MMTAIDPFASLRAGNATNTTTKTSNSEIDTDTFLQLLVAQLRYQNPLDPQDGTEFITQSAQFTMVEKLTSIEKQALNQTATNEVLAASSMIGRRVNAALNTGETPTPIATTSIDIGGNLPVDATAGAQTESTIKIYTSDGAAIPLRVQFTKVDHDGANDWSLRTFVGNQQISGPVTVSFDASGQCTTSGVSISALQLDRIAGTSGKWDESGVALSFGSATDPARLHSGVGGASASARSQDGSDGMTFNGVVTGVRFDINGPILRIGNHEVPMGAVLEVQMPST